VLQCEHVPRATASLAKALHQGCCAACRWAQRHRQHDAQPVSRELGWDETQLVEQRATPCAPQATRSCAAGGCCTSVQHLAGLLHGATPPIRGGCGTSVQHPAPHGRLLYLRAATPLGRGFWTERPATSPPRGGLLCEVSVAGRSLQPRARAHTHTHILWGFLVGSLQHYQKIHQAMQELKENPQSSQDDDVDAGASL